MNFGGFAAALFRKSCQFSTGFLLIALIIWALPGVDAQQALAISNASAGAGPAAKPNSATISGTVLDTNGSEIQGAQVVLTTPDKASQRTQQTDGDGAFSFTGLPAGTYTVKVGGKGWGTFVSQPIQLHPGDFHIVPQIELRVATSASVRVVADPEVLAEEQVQIAEQQRVLGVFPNFYSSYDWNAPPMGAKQKYQLAFRSLIDPVTFLSAGTIAGIEQYNNSFSGYGSGAQGYAKRFGAAYADDVLGRMISKAILPSVFHQDPRYFYRGTGSVRSRAFYAISAAVMVRGDNKHWEPAYARILGSFAAGGLSNLYYPAENRGVGLTLTNGAIDIASNAGVNLVREFVLKKFTTMATRHSVQGNNGNSH